MGRVVKWLLIGLAGVLGLIVVFVAAVLLIVDPNDYRDDITRVVQQQTGRELTIQGDLGLSFFPWFGIEAGGIRLADAPAFGDEPILQVKNVTLAVKVMPLLSGNLVVDTIVLDRPQLHLVRDAKGNANWEALGKGKPQARLQREARVVPVAMAASGDGQAGPAVPEIVRTAALAGVRVRQASIRYEDLGAGTKARVDPLNLELQNIQLGEPIQVEADWQAALDGGPAVQGQLSTEATVARDLSKAQAKDVSLDVTASGDAIPAGKQEASLRAQVEADLKQGLYRITGIRLDAAGIAATGQAETRMSKQGPITTGMLEIPPTSPRDIMDQLAVEVPKTRDSDALQNLEGSVTFRVVGSRVELKPLRLALDKSTLNGEATIRDFAGPAADFDLALDNIDVDRYLPPPSETEEKSGEEPAKGEKKPTPLPVDMLRGLDLNGRLRIAKLKASGATVTDADITITAKNGDIRVHPIKAKLYKGTYDGDMRLDATKKQPEVSLNENVKGVQAEPLLADLAKFDKLLGTSDFSLQAKARGETVDDIIEALKGQAKFEFKDGAVKGINLAQTLRDAYAKVQGEKAQKTEDTPRQTDFTVLGGTVTFDGPVVRNDDLSAKSPLLRVAGKGEANWLKQTVDYRLTVNVVSSLEGQGGASLENLKGVPVPLRFHGKLTEPKVDLDLQSALEARAKKQVEEKKTEVKKKAEAEAEKQKAKVEEKVKKDVEKKLEGLFKK